MELKWFNQVVFLFEQILIEIFVQILTKKNLHMQLLSNFFILPEHSFKSVQSYKTF